MTKPSKKISKKAKRSKRERIIAEAIEVFKVQTEARYRLARAAFDSQDEETQAVILAIIDRLRLGAAGVVKVFPGGKRNEAVTVPMEQKYQDFNLMFIATEILKDLALMDVRVATYEIPKTHCAECGVKIKRKKAA